MPKQRVPVSAGDQYGKWVIINAAFADKSACPKVFCRCQCGTERYVDIGNLTSGRSKSCGCYQYVKAGKRYGRWTAIEIRPSKPHDKWLCRCDCGTEHEVNAYALIQGVSRSCGCLKRETTIERSTVHGKHEVPEYEVWCGMKARCSNPDHVGYRYYGGKGVVVCQRWADSFEAFYTDMGPRPSAKHSIDRINYDGNYEPENCRWATAAEQVKNRRPYTHCPNGHEYTAKTVGIWPNGKKHCLICTAAKNARARKI